MSKQSLPVDQAGFIVRDLIKVICANRDHLSEIDAAIGDGDHGINMSKGFAQCGQQLDTDADDASLVTALDALSETLLDGIGGSMGPLYGSFFMNFGEVLEDYDQLDAIAFAAALRAATESVQELGEAAVGDKTLLDTLVPAAAALDAAIAAGDDFSTALAAMVDAAETGKDSTRDLQAKVGRAARLGERSIGVLDAGAVSCFLILQTMAASITQQLQAGA